MEKDEIFTVLKKIEAVYPQFKISDETLVVWMKMCREMDGPLVHKRLTAHIEKSPFPPVIAEIAAYKKLENFFLEQTKQWENEGRERIERDHQLGRTKPELSWLSNPNTSRVARG